MLSRVEQVKGFITSGPGLVLASFLRLLAANNLMLLVK